MLISCNKIKNYIKNSEDIDWINIWDTFTIRTAEVENVKVVGNEFDNVVVAEIKTCEEHPDSDHMHVLQVDCGDEELTQVVCGAPNVRVGLKTAFVKVGGHIDGMLIKARPLRGIISNGMCCSFRELSIGDSHDGIIELPADAPVGMDIKQYLPIEDVIVEIDNKSLTNRPDLWGHLGIAREIAAITNHELKTLELENIVNNQNDLDIKIINPELCSRYTGLKIANIENQTTPIEMQIFLNRCGQRSISLIVDLTNYIMLELGQPMHAFDSRIVKNIEVGLAHDNDTFTTLDGVERKLSKDNLMIKNGDDYFAIAGVMGGLNSEIEKDTTSFFLESATFNAGSVRKTAISLGLRTEASARYEKSLDPNMTDVAIKRLVYLLKQENPNLEIASNLTDVYPHPLQAEEIILPKELLNKYMGTNLPEDTVKKLLEPLGFQVKIAPNNYEVCVPTYRRSKDIKIAEDLIEEIARMYGLENFTPKPLKLDLTINEHETTFNQEYAVKELLATKYDMHEVHSYLWYDSNTLKKLGVDKTGVKLLGKTENNVLRDDLSFSLLNIVERNFKDLNQFSLFEIGTIIKNNKNKRILSIIIAGEDKNIATYYNHAKNVVTYLFKILKHQIVTFINSANTEDYYDANLAKKIIIDGEEIGSINVLDKVLTNKLSKKKVIIAIDIDFDKFVNINSETITEKVISKYPNVILDYTVILPKDYKYSDLKHALDTFKSNLIDKYELIDVYENKYLIEYTLSSMTKTLEQKELQTFKEQFIDHIKKEGMDIKE